MTDVSNPLQLGGLTQVGSAGVRHDSVLVPKLVVERHQVIQSQFTEILFKLTSNRVLRLHYTSVLSKLEHRNISPLSFLPASPSFR